MRSREAAQVDWPGSRSAQGSFARPSIPLWSADGTEAVQLAQQAQPDVILMDTRMPVMDGLEATHAIVACGPSAGPRFFHVSGRHMIQTMRPAGAAGYVEGSVSLELLLAAIRGRTRRSAGTRNSAGGLIVSLLAQRGALRDNASRAACLFRPSGESLRCRRRAPRGRTEA